MYNATRTPKLFSAGLRIPDARAHTLADQIALKLGDG